MKEIEGWSLKSLGQIADMTMGQSPDSKHCSDEEIGMPFLQGCAEFTSKYPVAKHYCSQKRKVGKINSILFSVRAPVGKTNIADRDYIIGRGLASFIGLEVDQGYLKQYLAFRENSFRNASQGSTFEAINFTELVGFKISFPTSKPEQTKIAEILSTVDKAIEQTEALIAKQQRIKTGLMQDLLTRGIDEDGNLRSEQTHQFKDSPLGKIPIEWEVQELQKIVLIIDSLHQTPQFTEDGFAMVRGTDIKFGKLSLNNCVKVSGSVFDEFTKNHIPQAGDIVMSRVGTYGISSFVEIKDQFCIGQNTVIITGHQNSLFLFEFLRTPFVRSYFDLQLTGSSQKTLSLKAIRETPTLVMSTNEMNRIGQILSTVDKAIEQSKALVTKLQSLKTALMQDLLTGKKRVIDPPQPPLISGVPKWSRGSQSEEAHQDQYKNWLIIQRLLIQLIDIDCWRRRRILLSTDNKKIPHFKVRSGIIPNPSPTTRGEVSKRYVRTKENITIKSSLLPT